MLNSLKIQRADGSSTVLAAVSQAGHHYNDNGTATLELTLELPEYQDEREITLHAGDVAFLMSPNGNTITPFFPTPKRQCSA